MTELILKHLSPFQFITMTNNICSNKQLREKMDIHHLSDLQFTFMVGMANQSTAPDLGEVFCLPILMEEHVKMEFGGRSSKQAYSGSDMSTYTNYGILPTSLFPGSTRTVQMKNRAIAWIGFKLGKDLSHMYSTNQDSDSFRVDCLRCNQALEVTRLGHIHQSMRDHEEVCSGRKYCYKCFTLYSGPFGQWGTSRVMHEKSCLDEEHEFLERLDWLQDSRPNPPISEEYKYKHVWLCTIWLRHQLTCFFKSCM